MNSTVLSYPQRGEGGDAKWRGNHARVSKAESSGTDWKAIVRRVLQETCQSVERGVWALPQYVS